MPSTPSFKEMPLWQHAVELSADIASLTAGLPQSTNLTIVANLQDAASAIPIELARGTKGGKKRFLEACLISRQTIAEIDTLLIILSKLYTDTPVDELLTRTAELEQGLVALARRLSSSPATHQKQS